MSAARRTCSAQLAVARPAYLCTAVLNGKCAHLPQTVPEHGIMPFRDARARRRAVEWLAGNSLVGRNAVRRFLDEHPEPAVP